MKIGFDENSAFRKLIRKYGKHAPVAFFMGGFVFDSLTLQRVDRLYDLMVLCSHMTLLTITLYLFNVSEDGRWKNTFLERYEAYFPLAIQFFFGALSSAYVIYFSRSVSLSKTIPFFVILVVLLIANEFLKRRISNKYLQFSVYYFISFTFFTFIIPVFVKEMNTKIFIFSGLVSLGATLGLILYIYKISPSTRREVKLSKLIGIILTIHILINSFYFLKLIPPVPLALQTGIAAHDVQLENGTYTLTYEANDWYVFWRDHQLKFNHVDGENVYVFTSIFAPTDIKKSVYHRWNWYNDATNDWETVEDIGFDITGGRDGGFRGYTFKNNTKPGRWKVEVITSEELIIGVVKFELIYDEITKPLKLINEDF